MTAHLPVLSGLKWHWYNAFPGTFLIEYGKRDRTFFWIDSGEAKILGRNKEGDVVHTATLHGHTGVGEIAFLDDRPRNADVLITKPSLVASITYDQFQSVITKEGEDKFRCIILAGHALEKSKIFSQIPLKDREKWILNGLFVTYNPGEDIFHEGDDERWMGMILDGEADVLYHGAVIGKLRKGDVFGEIAFLGQGERTATVVCRKETYIEKWDADWLLKEIDRIGIRKSLEKISEQRMQQQVEKG